MTDFTKLAEMLQYIKENQLDFRSILISHNDKLVMETYFHPFTREDRSGVASIAKSVTSCLIGIAIDKGYIKKNLDQKVIELFPEYTFRNMTDNKKAITLRHLLTMTSGLMWPNDTPQTAMMSKSDTVQFVLNKSAKFEPGTVFNYNTGGIQLLSSLITKTTGMSTIEFARENLFNPLDIKDFVWKTTLDGIAAGGNLLFLRPRDLLKLGQLYLNQGKWNGKQIVSALWVKESTQVWSKTNYVTNDVPYDYGYLWWIAHGGNQPNYFIASGFKGQYIFIMPDKQMVVVITALLPVEDSWTIPYRIFHTYIVGALNSNKEISENREAKDLLSRLSEQAENPTGRTINILNKKTVTISKNIYHFNANPSNLKSLNIKFDNNKEAILTLKLKTAPVTIPVGLDNLYRKSKVEKLVEKVDYFYDYIQGTVGFKGGWTDDNTFIITMMPFEQSLFLYYMKMIFKENIIKLTVYRKELPDPKDLSQVGKLRH